MAMIHERAWEKQTHGHPRTAPTEWRMESCTPMEQMEAQWDAFYVSAADNYQERLRLLEEAWRAHTRALEERVARLEKEQMAGETTTLEGIMRDLHAHLRTSDGVDPTEFAFQRKFPLRLVNRAVEIFQGRGWLAGDEE